MIDVKNYLQACRYCESLYNYKRRKTWPVDIGGVPVGGNNPIRIQSMTIANTRDTEASVAEVMQLADAGCEYVRLTAPSKREAENLQNIKDKLRSKGYHVPLIADIHFTPNAAEIAAQIVDKVRINPGNYADKKRFQVFEFSDEAYQEELERIREKFSPLVKLCKQYGTAMRIGTNHGSLSDRIMNRYGDTPAGMVESAMEFLRIAEDHDFHQIVLSMKASNPKVMVQAYRMLVAKMNEEAMYYPLHLGVTEAGDGEEARIKSACGIGTLLEDGLGDTIRVSLTEDAVYEPPVARKLAERYPQRTTLQPIPQVAPEPLKVTPPHQDFDPFSYKPRKSREVGGIGGEHQKPVIVDVSGKTNLRPLSLKAIDHHYQPGSGQWQKGEHACDWLYLGGQILPFEPPEALGLLYDFQTWQQQSHPQAFPLWDKQGYLANTEKHPTLNFLRVDVEALDADLIEALKNDRSTVLLLSTQHTHVYPTIRKAILDLSRLGMALPVIPYTAYEEADQEAFVLHAATDQGALLVDGLTDGIWINYTNPQEQHPINTIRLVNRVSFDTMQATGARISKTEFIACPSCGRTQFDLQETTAMVKAKTSHLQGVKIAVMGCIVNGPGEMADADYGYVGTGRGKVALYRGKEIVKKNLSSDEALDELIKLIKADGNWVDAPELETETS